MRDFKSSVRMAYDKAKSGGKKGGYSGGKKGGYDGSSPSEEGEVI